LDKVQIYKKVGDIELRMHLFLPKEKNTEKRPVIIYFFGGWVRG